MKTLRISFVGFLSGLLVTALAAQDAKIAAANNFFSQSQIAHQLHIPPQLHPHSATARFLMSDEGRAWYQVSGHPLSKYLNQAFGEPPAAAVERAKRQLQPRNAAQISESTAAATVPCTGPAGARFNLEPRANAMPQGNAIADFILNGAGTGEDLIVGAADDARGMVASKTWDNSISAYYVHRSGSDCSVQFEGGLPNFAFEGNETFGIGSTAVAADPVRQTFFMADSRFGATSGIALFRASAANLLNPTNCANGTHLLAEAQACWAQTAPVLIDPQSQANLENGTFNLAVDERATGTGAGNVYLVASAYVPDGPNGTCTQACSNTVFIVACTNTLQCSPMTIIQTETAEVEGGYQPYAQVRPDGQITISYLRPAKNPFSNVPLVFTTCTPAGAPKAPVCAQASTVTTIANPIPTNLNGFLAAPLKGNYQFVMFTYPKHANRKESDGSFTTFLAYDDCKNPYQYTVGIQGEPVFCLNAEVRTTFSTDDGKTWSSPISVDTAAGHHFFPAITTDQSTGTTNLVYYSTEGGTFHHQVRVFLNQIAAGSTTLGAPKPITTAFAPMDVSATGTLFDDGGDNFRIGAIARGTGTAGDTHLYTSFSITFVNGSYGGEPVPEMNNQISLLAF